MHFFTQSLVSVFKIRLKLGAFFWSLLIILLLFVFFVFIDFYSCLFKPSSTIKKSPHQHLLLTFSLIRIVLGDVCTVSVLMLLSRKWIFIFHSFFGLFSVKIQPEALFVLNSHTIPPLMGALINTNVSPCLKVKTTVSKKRNRSHQMWFQWEAGGACKWEAADEQPSPLR